MRLAYATGLAIRQVLFSFFTNNQTRTIMENIENVPHDIIFRILLRLPAVSLLRLRTMSKLYRKTIDDEDFARSQYSLMGDKDPNLLFRYYMDFNVDQLRVDGKFLRPVPGSPTLNQPGELQCSTNGFLLFSTPSPLDQEGIVLWNPLRREHIVLSPPETTDRAWSNQYGLGFDSGMKEYKIVCLFSYMFQSTGAKIYSSKTKSWKETKNSPVGAVNSSPVFLNGSIYWISLLNRRNGLLSFDVQTEEFRFHSEIDLPSCIVYAGLFSPHGLMELGGYLVLGGSLEVLGWRRLQNAWTLVENDWRRIDVVDSYPQRLHELYYDQSCCDEADCEIFYYLTSDGLRLRSSKKLIQRERDAMLCIYRCKQTLISLNDF